MNVRTAHIIGIRPYMGGPRTPPRGRPALPVDQATPGGRLRALRVGARKDQEALATELGVTRPVISRYETGQISLPDYVIERASQLFGVTPAFIRYGDTESRMVQVLGRVGAGAHIEAIEAPPWRYVEVPASWSDALALEISGDSCYPIYEDRDVIVARGHQRLLEEEFIGKMCVVETQDGLGLVKRVRRGSWPNLFSLESPNAPPIDDVALMSARPVKLRISS